MRYVNNPVSTVNPRADRTFFIFNAIVSTSAIAFIAFILFRDVAPAAGTDLSYLPAVNAACNALAALCLVIGYIAIRRRAVHAHRICMVSAFTLSAIFLVGYLTYHFVHGDTRYTGTGAMRGIYFFILITHIVSSISVVPLALTSFYFAFKHAWDRHRRLNRVFLPIWLYVSVTGVIIFFMLRG